MKRADVVFSGMRPTGRLHLGNYWGALKNWVDLQSQYPCLFSVADWHMLTTGYGDTAKLRDNVREMALDWLAAGLDPEKCVIFRQSDVPEHAELALMLAMVTPLSSLENNPTWKEQLQELSKTKLSKALSETAEEKLAESTLEHARAAGAGPRQALHAAEKALEAAEATAAQYELRTYGFLGYPVLQAADILLYHGTKVPVGQDQLPHLELSREIARKFNNAFGDVFAEPEALLTQARKVPGLDGRKMSKSYGNAVDIYETRDSLKRKVMAAYTDPTRGKATDPGHPEPCPENEKGCSVFALEKLYADEAFVARRRQECMAGKIGCFPCKKDLLGYMDPAFAEFRERRDSYKASDVDAILADGAKKAGAIAERTMDEVRRAMRLR